MSATFNAEDRGVIQKWASLGDYSITTPNEKSALKTAFEHALSNIQELKNDKDKEQFIRAFIVFSNCWISDSDLETPRKVCLIMAATMGTLTENDMKFLDNAIKESRGLQDLGVDAKLQYLAKRPDADIHKIFTQDQIAKLSNDQLLWLMQICDRGSVDQWKALNSLVQNDAIKALKDDLNKDRTGISDKLPFLFQHPNVPIDKLFTKEQLNQLDPGELLAVFKICNQSPVNRNLLKSNYQPGFLGTSYDDMMALIQETPRLMNPEEKVYYFTQNPTTPITEIFTKEEILNLTTDQFIGILKLCDADQREAMLALCAFNTVSDEKYDGKKLAYLRLHPETSLERLYTKEHLNEYDVSYLTTILSYCNPANRETFQSFVPAEFAKAQRSLPVEMKWAILKANPETPIDELFTNKQLNQLSDGDLTRLFVFCCEAGAEPFRKLRVLYKPLEFLPYGSVRSPHKLSVYAKTVYISNHPEVAIENVFSPNEFDVLLIRERSPIIDIKLLYFEKNPNTPIGEIFTKEQLEKLDHFQRMKVFEICGTNKQFKALKELYGEDRTPSFTEMVDATKVDYLSRNPKTPLIDIFPDSTRLMRLSPPKLATVFKLCKEDPEQMAALRELYKPNEVHNKTFEEMLK